MEFRVRLRNLVSFVHKLTALPGSGKTVLATYLLEKLLPDSVVLFFFCNGNDQARRTPEGVVYTLLGQILDHPALSALQEDVSNTLLPLYQLGAEKRSLSLDTLCKSLRDVIELLPAATILLDGIDELVQDGHNRRLLLETLLNLGTFSSRPLRTLFLSRTEDELEEVFGEVPNIPITPSDIQNDVQTFLESELDKIPRLNRSGLRQQIMAKLSAGAGGMFLWVALMLETLKRASNQNEVNEFLENLPVGLNAVYSQILLHFGKALHPGERRLRNAILTWTATALRPLTIGEMNEALAVHPGLPTLDEGQLMFEPKEDILRTCAPLLHISGGQIKFVHFSVKEFLCRDVPSSFDDNPGFDFEYGQKPAPLDRALLVSVDLSHSNAMLASTCLAYLAFQSLSSEKTLLDAASAIAGGDGDFARHFQSHAFLEYASINWPKHLVLSSLLEDDLQKQLKTLFEPAKCLFWLMSYLELRKDEMGGGGHAELVPITSSMNEWLSNHAANPAQILTMDDDILIAAMQYGCKLYGDAFGHGDDRFLAMAGELASLYTWRQRGHDAELVRTEILEAHATRTGRQTAVYAETLKKVAQSKSMQDKGEVAIKDLEEALALQKTLLGEEDAATLDTYKELGWQYQKQRIDSAKGATYLEKALYGMQKAHGPRHRLTLTAEMYLADAYRTLGRLEEAEKLLKNNYEVCKEIWGPDHLELMTVMYNLARVYREQKKLELAAEYMEMVLASDLKVRPDHVYVSYSRYEIGLIYRDMGKLEDAHRYLGSALEGMLEKLDAGSLFIRKTVQELAEIEEEQRQKSGPKTQAEQPLLPTSLDEGQTQEASRQGSPSATPHAYSFPDVPTYKLEENVAPRSRQQMLVAE
jgi:tetratricopeptide (TPR) repeat protein